MSKYSKEFKLEVVNYYLQGNGGYIATAQKFGIAAFGNVRKWVKKYEQNGDNGLEKNKDISYSGKFKLNVIEYMHKNHLSRQETAFHFNLGDTSVVSKWERIYNEEGPLALSSGRKNMISKPRKKKISKEEDLIAENERLRMENAYLKKLQALIQERTKPRQKKK